VNSRTGCARPCAASRASWPTSSSTSPIARKLWRELGYTSPFHCVRSEFKLSAGAAYNRIAAADLILRFPEVEAALRSGQLCLSTVTEVAKVLTPENKDEVLPRFFGLSRREAEQVRASLRPVEVIPVRDVVTAIRPSAPAVRAVVALPMTRSGSGLPVHGCGAFASPCPDSTRSIRSSTCSGCTSCWSSSSSGARDSSMPIRSAIAVARRTRRVTSCSARRLT
jgi:hypothetical protein